MGAGAAQLLRPPVHFLHKSIHRGGDVQGRHRNRVVCRFHHDGVHQLLHGDDLPHHQIHAIGIPGHRIQRRLGNGDLIVHVSLFRKDQAGHNLRQAAGEHLHIRVVGVQQRIRIQLIQERGIAGLQQILVPRQRNRCIHSPAAQSLLGRRSGSILRPRRLILRLFGKSRRCQRQQQGKRKDQTPYFFHFYSSLFSSALVKAGRFML